MISSAAFFSHLPCPFRRMGLCERPHCHFSHVEPETSGSRSGTPLLPLVQRGSSSSLTFDASLLSSASKSRTSLVKKSSAGNPVDLFVSQASRQSDSRNNEDKVTDAVKVKMKTISATRRPIPPDDAEPMSISPQTEKRPRSEILASGTIVSHKKQKVAAAAVATKTTSSRKSISSHSETNSNSSSRSNSPDNGSCDDQSSVSSSPVSHPPKSGSTVSASSAVVSGVKKRVAHLSADESMSSGRRPVPSSGQMERKQTTRLTAKQVMLSRFAELGVDHQPLRAGKSGTGSSPVKLNTTTGTTDRSSCHPLNPVSASVKSTATSAANPKSRISSLSSAGAVVVTICSSLTTSGANDCQPMTAGVIRSRAINAPTVSSGDQTGGRKRIAHAVKPDLSANTPLMVTSSLSSSFTSSSAKSSKTSSSSSCNGEPRAKRPIFPLDYASSSSSAAAKKIPLIARQQLINKLIDEFLKVPATSDSQAFESGLREEKSVCDRAKTRQMYSMIAANTLLKIRAQVSGGTDAGSKNKSKVTPEGNNILNHEAILNGNASNYTIVKREKVDIGKVPDKLLHQVLQKFLIPTDDLKNYGYPYTEPSEPNKVIIPFDDRCKLKSDFSTNRRICCRCKAEFIVDKETGVPVEREACVYHPGRVWNQRSQGSMQKIFSCCRSDSSAAGCDSADAHVVDGTTHPNYANGFVRTKRKEVPNEDFGIYALDCEMCNTTVGMELTRVTVIDTKCSIVMDSFVKPDNQILDYNTRFSGIVAGDLDGVTTTLPEIQRKLKKMFNDRTILIGHSLDSDFKALKLLHTAVVDTAHMFPHRKGLPFKRALRTIVAETMSQIIQDSAEGHDSAEDAISCMKLVLLKAAEDANHRLKIKDPKLFAQLLSSSSSLSPSSSSPPALTHNKSERRTEK